MRIVFLLFILFSCSSKAEVTFFESGKQVTNIQQSCKESGGQWKMLSNGCGDSCKKYESEKPLMCTMALQEGCDCGESKCFDGANHACRDIKNK